MRTSHNHETTAAVTTIGIDLGKITFHIVGFDKRGIHRSAAKNIPRSDRTPAGQYSEGFEPLTSPLRDWSGLTNYG